jgi:hypothetical protein
MKFSKWTFLQYIITRVSITLSPLSDTSIQIVLKTEWHAQAPAIDVRLPGYEPVTLERNATSIILTKEEIPT